MSDTFAVRAEARLAMATADRCRALAAEIDRRRRLLVDRIEPARRAHTADVWSSGAATASRDQLVRYVAPAAWFVASDLGATARRLRDEAERMEGEVRTWLGHIVEIDAEAAGDSIAGDAVDPSLGAAVPPVHGR